jgi:hypothetical protein
MTKPVNGPRKRLRFGGNFEVMMGILHEKHTEQFGNQLIISSRTKENHGKPYSSWPVARPF